KILIENKGNVDIENAIIHLRIDSANTQIQLISDTITSITAYTTFSYEFTKSYTVPNLENTQQTYAIKASIEPIGDDTDKHDNSLEKLACAIYNDVAIVNAMINKWSVGQNIPNPASHSTSIPYSIPQEGSICFQLMSISGQTLFEKTIHAHSGNHYLEINTLLISNGMYYYSITYRGERKVKKMTIQK
ncbi:MAG: T9SS type A sorting domain-containing protein, partial [Bacteroidales bacterium]|nr:T9SS type A sorting domain-containing protein [Bacteroidales bacterium]